MIVRDKLEFHAAELLPMPGSGFALVRVPRKISDTLDPRGRFVAHDSVNTEIRFYTTAPRLHIFLSAQEISIPEEAEVNILFGDFEGKTERIPCGGGIRQIVIERPPAMDKVKPEKIRRAPGIGFDPNVIRIMPNRSSLIYHAIDSLGYDVRPPEPEEKPALKCLCYGSSITNSRTLGYPFVMAHTLGVDFCNIGMSGACHMEPQLIDWMADGEWDFAVLELGINTLDLYTPEEFSRKAEYSICKFAETGKPVIVFTMFPYGRSKTLALKNCASENYDKFNCILREICQKKQRKNLILLEGDSVADELFCLSVDFLHPRAYGHFRMGMNLAKQIEKHLPEYFPART